MPNYRPEILLIRGAPRYIAGVLVPATLAFTTALSAQAPVQEAQDSGGRKPPIQILPVNPADLPQPLPLDPATVAPEPSRQTKEHHTEFFGAPILISNPTIGSGGGALGALVFPLNRNDRVSPPTVAGIGGFYTDSNSYALGFGIRSYLAEDRWRFLLGAAKGKFHYDFFGVGAGIGTSEKPIPLAQDVSAIAVEVTPRILGRLFIGTRYLFAHTTLAFDREADPEINPPEKDRSARLAALGLHAQIDSRDSTFYPLHGSLFDLRADFYEPAFGGERAFQGYRASYNAYVASGERKVLALRVSACSVRGDAPVYSLCLFGVQNDLRGYEVGLYLDRVMLATQAEYRWNLPENLGFFGRFGVVVFVGVGEVAKSFGDLNSENLLPSGGVGVRFLVARENHINFRIDYAWGKAGSKGLYVGVGEAF